MTPEQFAQFTIFNELNFYGGLLLGLLIAGFFKTLMSFFYSNVQRPRRIRLRNLNGRHERKDNFEYLYLFENEYYTLEQRDFLIKERVKNIKPKFLSPLELLFVFLLLFLAIFYFFFQTSNSSILGI